MITSFASSSRVILKNQRAVKMWAAGWYDSLDNNILACRHDDQNLRLTRWSWAGKHQDERQKERCFWALERDFSSSFHLKCSVATEQILTLVLVFIQCQFIESLRKMVKIVYFCDSRISSPNNCFTIGHTRIARTIKIFRREWGKRYNTESFEWGVVNIGIIINSLLLLLILFHQDQKLVIS